MNAHLDRARILMQQDRHEQAIQELNQSLLNDPNDGYAISLLAINLCEVGDVRRAREAAGQAIALEPDNAFCFFAASLVSFQRNDVVQSRKEIERAIAIDSYEPDYFAQLATLDCAAKSWQLASDHCEAGLELDPDHVGCSNIRSLALTKLGRRHEAGVSIQSTLQNAPEDAFSHANMGWELLHQGNPKKALVSFKEALRLEPEMEYARLGIVEAMKGQFFVYRIFLTWILFCSKLKSKYLMAIIVGGYIAIQIFTAALKANPGLKWILLPPIILYIAFAVMTWIATPIFNLILRTSKFGRLVLSHEETRTSTWVGVAISGAILSLVGWLLTSNQEFAYVALASALATPTLAFYYSSDDGWPRAIHGLMIIGIVGLGGLFAIGVTGEWFFEGVSKNIFLAIAATAATPFTLLAIGSQFAVNFLAMASPQKGTQAGKLTWLIGGAVLAMAFLGYALVTFAVAAALISMPVEGEANIAEPLNVEFQEQPVVWRIPKKIEQCTRELEELGLQSVGDFGAKQRLGFRKRLFLHPEENVVAIVGEQPFSDKVSVSLSATMETGGRLEVCNSPPLHSGPENWEVYIVKGSLTTLWAKLLDELPETAAQELAKEELPGFLSELHAELTSHLYRKGGFSNQEAANILKLISGQAPDESGIASFQKKWKADAAERLDSFAINDFVEKNPKYEGRQEFLFCVHEYTSRPRIILTSAILKKKGMSFGEEQLKAIKKLEEGSGESVDPRKMAAGLFEIVGNSQLVATVEGPILTDVYLLTKPGVSSELKFSH